MNFATAPSKGRRVRKYWIAIIDPSGRDECHTVEFQYNWRMRHRLMTHRHMTPGLILSQFLFLVLVLILLLYGGPSLCGVFGTAPSDGCRVQKSLIAIVYPSRRPNSYHGCRLPNYARRNKTQNLR